MKKVLLCVFLSVSLLFCGATIVFAEGNNVYWVIEGNSNIEQAGIKGYFTRYYQNIKSIHFVDTSEESYDFMNYEYEFDLSRDQDESVYGFLRQNGSNYDLYIVYDGTLVLNSNASGLFYDLPLVEQIEGLNNVDTSSVTNMHSMFRKMPKLQSLDATALNTSNATDMSWMFNELSLITSLDVSSFNTSKVTTMLSMFSDMYKLKTLNLSNFNTAKVTNMGWMFSSCYELESVNLSSFNTSNVEWLTGMFYNNYALKSLNLSNFNTKNVVETYGMFYNANSLKTLDLSSFNTTNVINMGQMFAYCTSLENLNVSSFDTSNVTHMNEMFRDTKLKTLDLSNFNTANVTNMSKMFLNNPELVSLNVTSFDTSKVTTMENMFAYCPKLNNLDLLNFNTSNVTDMSYMFDNLKTPVVLDVSSFDTSKVTKMQYMFSTCINLKKIIASDKFVVNKVSNSTYMFYYTPVEGEYGTEHVISSMINIAKEYARLDTASTPGYFSSTIPMEYVDYICDEFTYDGTAKEPVCTFSFNNKELTEDDYKVMSVSDNINAGVATAVIKGKNHFSKMIEVEYQIQPLSIGDFPVETVNDYEYTGSEIKPDVIIRYNETVLEKDVDYTLSYRNNINVGTATIIITGNGNFGGTKEVTFTINSKDIADLTISGVVDKQYSGEEITQDNIVVKYGDIVLVKDADYTLSYENNTEIGEATVTITGKKTYTDSVHFKGNYTGSVSRTFNITKRNISTLDFSNYNNIYTSKEIIPNIIIKNGNITLVKDRDYTLEVTNNINVGTGHIKVTGIGNYTGEKELDFAIAPASISTLTVDPIEDVEYICNYIRPEITPTITLGDTVINLTEDDYDLEYKDNLNAGTATITITGKGNYTGSKDITFTITKVDIAKAVVSNIEEQEWAFINPSYTISYNDIALLEGTDYTKEIKTYDDYGEIVFTGKGNYTGTVSKRFNLIATSIGRLTIEEISSQVYTGSNIEPGIVIKNNDTILVEDIDYIVTYTRNINVGEAIIKVEGTGKYKDSFVKTFTITSKNINNVTIENEIETQKYTGNNIEPSVVLKDDDKLLILNEDYTLTYQNNINVGVATIVITGINNYAGERTLSFNIKGNIEEAIIDGLGTQLYASDEIIPNFDVTLDKVLVNNTDYTYSIVNNVNVGIATVTITGKGNYYGTVTRTFEIAPLHVKFLNVRPVDSQTYTGDSLTPAVTIKYNSRVLVEGVDYSLSYTNNIEPGTATITITGIGNYGGAINKTFTILPKSSVLTIETIDDQLYTGDEITPEVLVYDGDTLLELNKDYTVSYVNNTEVGTAEVMVKGINHYQGTVYSEFNILGDIKYAIVNGLSNQIYSGNPYEPKLEVFFGDKELIQDEDYTLEYFNSTNAGTASVTITGIGKYTGTITKTFKISPKGINSLSISGISNQRYTGKAITLKVVVKDGDKQLVLNKDYTLSYSNNINIGTATIRVTGKGNYTGTVNKTFKIQYGIIYQLNGGVNNKNNPFFYDGKSNVKLNNPTRKGYIFKGWYTDKKLKKKANIKKGSKGNITVYAKWTAIKYTVKFNANGGKGKMSNLKNKTYDKAFTLTANKYTKGGYNFLGWTLNSNGTGTLYKNKQSVKNLSATNKGTVTLYAKWSPVYYSIKYVLNGGTNNQGNPTTYNINTNNITLKNPTRSGYTFAGWYSDSKFKNKVTVIKKGSTGNKTLYAKWTALLMNVKEISITIKDKGTIHATFKGKGYLYSSIEDPSIISCSWGSWYGSGNSDLTCTAKKPGTTYVTITNSDNKESKKVKVTVLAPWANVIVEIPETIGNSSAPENRMKITEYNFASGGSTYYKMYLKYQLVKYGKTSRTNWGAKVYYYDIDGNVIDDGYIYASSLALNGIYSDDLYIPMETYKIVFEESPEPNSSSGNQGQEHDNTLWSNDDFKNMSNILSNASAQTDTTYNYLSKAIDEKTIAASWFTLAKKSINITLLYLNQALDFANSKKEWKDSNGESLADKIQAAIDTFDGYADVDTSNTYSSTDIYASWSSLTKMNNNCRTRILAAATFNNNIWKQAIDYWNEN